MATLASKLVRGAVAGVVGTIAMDLLWWQRSRRDGSDDDFLTWEFAGGADSFDDAGAPAQVGRRAASLVGVDLPDEAADTTTNIMHWLTGVGYGIAHALVHGGAHPLSSGLMTGAGTFTNSYASLGALDIYDPIWEYDQETLAKDLTAHLVFGLGVGITHGMLSGHDRD